MSADASTSGKGRDVWVSLLFALGLWVMLAIAMVGVMLALPTDEKALDWPMIACALVAALYVAASWQFIPSVTWFVVGLLLWCVAAFVLLAVVPVEWLEFLFGPATTTEPTVPDAQ